MGLFTTPEEPYSSGMCNLQNKEQVTTAFEHFQNEMDIYDKEQIMPQFLENGFEGLLTLLKNILESDKLDGVDPWFGYALRFGGYSRNRLDLMRVIKSYFLIQLEDLQITKTKVDLNQKVESIQKLCGSSIEAIQKVTVGEFPASYNINIKSEATLMLERIKIEMQNLDYSIQGEQFLNFYNDFFDNFYDRNLKIFSESFLKYAYQSEFNKHVQIIEKNYELDMTLVTQCLLFSGLKSNAEVYSNLNIEKHLAQEAISTLQMI